MQNKIIIVDYGLGNLASIYNMLKKIGQAAIITKDLNIITESSKIILPGVGSFDNAMENIHENNLFETLNRKVLIDKVPILGICLGMQIMCNSSEEGVSKGFSWIDAEVLKFKFNTPQYKIPHMGWNIVNPIKNDTLFKELDAEEIRFYHVHSYYVKLNNLTNQLAFTNYQNNFTSAFQKNNIYGVQFHPEKSHSFGMKLLSNFSDIKC